MATRLPNGEFWSVSYSQSVMSSIIGPMGEAFGFRLLRMILPMKVVTVSTYVTPVTLSLTTWLELMLDIPGASPIDRVSMDTSSIFKQAVTPAKLCGGVEGFTGANAPADGEGSDGEGISGRWMGDFTGFICENGWDLPLSLEVWVG